MTRSEISDTSLEDVFERFEDRIEQARDVVHDFADDVENHVRDARRRVEK